MSHLIHRVARNDNSNENPTGTARKIQPRPHLCASLRLPRTARQRFNLVSFHLFDHMIRDIILVFFVFFVIL